MGLVGGLVAGAGIIADQSCNKFFVGNNLQGNTGNVGAIFAATTGANILVGKERS